VDARHGRGEGPDWAAVEARDYRPWQGADLRLDTAGRIPDDVLEALCTALDLG